MEARGGARCAAWIDVLLPYLRVKRADARLLREYCTFVLDHPHPGAAARAFSARELEILSVFGVNASMTPRLTRGARTAALAAEPVVFDPGGLAELDLAWLGGFFDGEGSIFMWTFERRGLQYQLPAVAINNTHWSTATRLSLNGADALSSSGPWTSGP